MAHTGAARKSLLEGNAVEYRRASVSLAKLLLQEKSESIRLAATIHREQSSNRPVKLHVLDASGSQAPLRLTSFLTASLHTLSSRNGSVHQLPAVQFLTFRGLAARLPNGRVQLVNCRFLGNECRGTGLPHRLLVFFFCI